MVRDFEVLESHIASALLMLLLGSVPAVFLCARPFSARHSSGVNCVETVLGNVGTWHETECGYLWIRRLVEVIAIVWTHSD